MDNRYSKNKQVKLGLPQSPMANFALADLSEQIFYLKEEVIGLKLKIHELVQQDINQRLELLAEKNSGYFTIEHVQKYFDISARLQQQDRTAKKLGYLKKKDGAKILYTKQHLLDYFANEFEEFATGGKA